MSYIDDLKKRMNQVGVPKSMPTDHSDKDTGHETENQYQDTTKVHEPVREAEIEPQEKDEIEVPGNLIQPEEKKEKQFYLSQTIIKAITNSNGEYRDVCPRAIYERYIEKSVHVKSMPMLEGIFGETLCLGGGAKGQSVTDLPRHKKTGEKLTNQLRIEEQARRFPIWCNEHAISIIPGVNTQLPIIKRWGNTGKRFIRTEIDIFPTPFIHNGQLKLAVMDLKFTADVDSRFGPKNNMDLNATPSGGWGAPEFIDHCQADITYWLLQDFDMELNIKHNPEKEAIYKSVFENETIVKMIKNEEIIFVYFILGYGKEPLEKQIKFIHREYRDPNYSNSDYRQRELHERIRKSYAQLIEWHKQEWPVKPSNLCDKCPVNKLNGGSCTMASKVHSI